MGLTFTKPKIQKVAAAVALAGAVMEDEVDLDFTSAEDDDHVGAHGKMAQLYALIDQVAVLDAEDAETLATIKALQAKLAPGKEARRKLAEEIEKLGYHPDEESSIDTGKTVLSFGKKGSQRKIVDLDKVKAAMGTELFMKLATVTLKNIDDYLNPEQKAECLTTERTDRTLKVTAK